LTSPLVSLAASVRRASYGQAGMGNWIVQGDNAVVLEAMQQVLGQSVRCIYIDPPYNNREEYEHYTDDRGHEEWLHGMEERLALMWPLLRMDGSIWISIDDGEAHYLKVLCDRLFGRDRFVTTVVWNHRKSRENRRVFSHNHEYILVYAADPVQFARSRNDMPLTAEILGRYKNPDNDSRGPWQSISANVQAGHAVASQFYEIVSPSGAHHCPPPGRCWVFGESKMSREIEAGNVWFGKDGRGVPRLKKFLRDCSRGVTPDTLWSADDVGTTHEAKREVLALFPGTHPFDTPKPERLISRILDVATDSGDLVLDAYLGSGTTAAVAHKTGRQYFGIEEGEHAASICARRLEKVVDGEQGGVSSLVGWTGGGGFDFFGWNALSEDLAALDEGAPRRREARPFWPQGIGMPATELC